MVLEGGTNDTTLQAGTPTESVTYTLPADDGSSGQVLATDGSGNLSWASAVPGSESLNDLTDVTITTPSDNQILKYDSSATQWQNESLTADDIPDGATNVIITSTQETNFETAYTHSQLTTGNPHDVTAAQAGAIADTNDSVKDGNIDWGTGAGQVSLDRVPDGSTSKLGQDCSTTGSPTFTSVNGIGLTENTTGFAVAGGSSTEKTLTVSETATIDQDLQQSASPLFSNLNLAGNVNLSNGSDRTVAVSQATSGNGNSLSVKAGDAYGTGNTEGGKLYLQAGAGGDGEDAEDGEIILKSEMFFDSVNLTGTAVFGRGVAGTDTSGQDLLILGGEPDEGSALDLAGGDIYITGGPSVNSGSDGDVILGYNPEESTAQGKVNFHNAYEFPTTDGTDGQVLTTDGSGNVSWEDAGTATVKPRMSYSTFWEDISNRWTLTYGGNSGIGIGTAYGLLIYGSQTDGYYMISLHSGVDIANFAQNPDFYTMINSVTMNHTYGELFWGYGTVTLDATGITFNANSQMGFKVIKDTTRKLYATNSDGTSETSTEITGVDQDDSHHYYCKFDGSTVKFYIDGVLKVTHTTNLPDNSETGLNFGTFAASAGTSNETFG